MRFLLILKPIQIHQKEILTISFDVKSSNNTVVLNCLILEEERLLKIHMKCLQLSLLKS